MELTKFFKEYKENIEIIEIIGESYYYSCEKLD